MSTKEGKYGIIAGPNEVGLMFSHFGRERGNLQVIFTLELVNLGAEESKFDKKTEKLVSITALEHEESGLASWRFKGLVNEGGYTIDGVYSHKTRIGTATICLRTNICRNCQAIWPWGRFKKVLDNCPHCKPKKWAADSESGAKPIGFALHEGIG